MVSLCSSFALNVSSFILSLTAKKAADEPKSDAQHVKEKVNTASPSNDNSPLPPFNPHNPVGKSGFIHESASVFAFSCLSQPAGAFHRYGVFGPKDRILL